MLGGLGGGGRWAGGGLRSGSGAGLLDVVRLQPGACGCGVAGVVAWAVALNRVLAYRVYRVGTQGTSPLVGAQGTCLLRRDKWYWTR